METVKLVQFIPAVRIDAAFAPTCFTTSIPLLPSNPCDEFDEEFPNPAILLVEPLPYCEAGAAEA